MKTGRQNLFFRRLGQQVSGKLFDRKLIETHILVVCIDDPVSPRPIGSGHVLLESIAIAVTGQIHRTAAIRSPNLGVANNSSTN